MIYLIIRLFKYLYILAQKIKFIFLIIFYYFLDMPLLLKILSIIILILYNISAIFFIKIEIFLYYKRFEFYNNNPQILYVSF